MTKKPVVSQPITWTNERRKLKDLIPWEHNPRSIDKKEAERLGDSLAEFGQIQTIAVDPDGEILDGHQRRLVWSILPKFGADYEVDVRVSSRKLTEKERQKLVVYLHKGTVGEWDKDILANVFELPDLLEWGFEAGDFELDWGKDEPQDAPEAQIDKAAELLEKWQVKTGDLFIIPSKTAKGEHRIICGDCTDRAVVERVMQGEKAGGMIADPPYGMRLNADFSGMVNKLDFAQEKGIKSGRKYDDVIGDDKDFDARGILSAIEDIDEQFWFGADYYTSTLPDTEHSGAWLVWDKRLDENADKMFGSCFELIWSKQKCKRDILRHKWAGVFGTEHEPQRGRQHPNQKPVVLIEDLIGRTNGIVIDPYIGSGTTLVACERLGRLGRGIEISPAYVAVSLQRLSDMGLTPVLKQ